MLWLYIGGGVLSTIIIGGFLWYLLRVQAQLNREEAVGIGFTGDAEPIPTAIALPAPATAPIPPAPRDWMADLVEAFHLLIIGGTRGGKTVLTHHVATERHGHGHQVLVCDPDARPGMWPACEVVGAGDDWAAISLLLGRVKQIIQKRRQDRAAGQRRFAPLTLVLSEAAYILAECEMARSVMEDVLRRGAKLGIHLLMDVQDSQTKTLGIEGQSGLLINLLRVEVCKVFDERRATINGQMFVIPTLTDPEALADSYLATHGLQVPSSDVPSTAKIDDLRSELEELDRELTPEELVERTTSINDKEQTAIKAMLDAGLDKTAIAKMLKGNYEQNRQKVLTVQQLQTI